LTLPCSLNGGNELFFVAYTPSGSPEALIIFQETPPRVIFITRRRSILATPITQLPTVSTKQLVDCPAATANQYRQRQTNQYANGSSSDEYTNC